MTCVECGNDDATDSYDVCLDCLEGRLVVGSLFAGVGGFDLAFERAGMSVAWQAEIDPAARAVLERHFPEAELYHDVRSVHAGSTTAVDLVCGGFPCQDVSKAGRRAGLDGDRSGLWREFHRILDDLRPPWFVIENVPVDACSLSEVLEPTPPLAYYLSARTAAALLDRTSRQGRSAPPILRTALEAAAT